MERRPIQPANLVKSPWQQLDDSGSVDSSSSLDTMDSAVRLGNSWRDENQQTSQTETPAYETHQKEQGHEQHKPRFQQVVRAVGRYAMTAALIVGIPAGVGRAIERHHIMSAEPTPGVEVAIKKGGSLDQALQDAAQHDPSLAIVMGTSLEKARDDAIKMNPEKLDPDGDGILNAVQPGTITAQTYNELSPSDK